MKPLSLNLFGSLLLLASTAISNAVDYRAGLLSYYPFDSSLTADVAFTNDFTAIGSPAFNPSGMHGNALQLNGTSQYLQLIHSTDSSINGFPFYKSGAAYSITFWVKGAAQTGKYIFTEGNSTNAAGVSQELFCIQTGNVAADAAKLDVIIRDSTTKIIPINHKVSASIVFDNTWHHVAWVDNRGSVQLYIDGNLDANSAAFSYSPSGAYNFDRAGVGALIRNSVGGYFNGSIDELSIWERPLTQAEVQYIRTNGISYPVPALPPALWSQPSSVTRYYSDSVTFSVTAQGNRPNNILSYQWNKNNSPIPDATNRTYRIADLTTSNSGELYSVTVSNGAGSVTSSNAILTVLEDVPNNLPNNIISYWPLDSVTNDAGNYSTIDLYGRNDFRLFNMDEYNLFPGVYGNGLLFDNLSTNYAVRTTGSPVYNTNGYSVSLWVNKLDGASSYQSDVRVFSEGATNNNNPLFTIGTTKDNSSLLKVYVRNDAGEELLTRASTRPVFDGNWHHIVWVDVNGQAKLYIDGAVDETDFTYTPSGTFSLNVTALGAVVRSAVGNNIFAAIDEVAAWSRRVSYNEVQEIKNIGIPAPSLPTPPSIVKQPGGTNALTRSDVSFSVSVSGVGPFTYQWFKDNSPLFYGTNAVLTLTNIQLSDAGSYKVRITNFGGSTNSVDVVLNVTQRAAPPASLAIDFNNRAESFGFTQDGFEEFTLMGSGGISAPTTRSFGGVEVTVAGSGLNVDSRRRGTPVNSGDFTEQKLLQDFIFAGSSSTTNGLDAIVQYLEPNQQYAVTIWSFDSGQPADGVQISDWYANGNLVQPAYRFSSSSLPTNNAQYQFSFFVTSDSRGKIAIQGRRNVDSTPTAVFLNALKVTLPVGPVIEKRFADKVAFTNTDVTLSVIAVGAGPITYQWYKNSSPLDGQNGRELRLSNVQSGDSGTYSVTVQNPISSTNLSGVLSVVSRPAPPPILSIDFNNRSEEAGFTESGFDSFVLDGAGTSPAVRNFGGVEVTVAGSNGTGVDSRRRISITNNLEFTQEKLLGDFIFSVASTGSEGLDVTARYLAPNQTYTVTIWSFDDQNPGLRTSDWYANGSLMNTYTFEGSTSSEPTNNSQYQFSFSATTDSTGTLLLQGRRNAATSGVSVFLNALRIAIPQTRVTSVERISGNLRLIVETPDSSKVHQVEQSTDLGTGSWSSVAGVSSTVLNAKSVQLEFPEPAGGIHFYRINRAP